MHHRTAPGTASRQHDPLTQGAGVRSLDDDRLFALHAVRFPWSEFRFPPLSARACHPRGKLKPMDPQSPGRVLAVRHIELRPVVDGARWNTQLFR